MQKDENGNYHIVVYDGNRPGNEHQYLDIAQAINKSFSRKGQLFCELDRPVVDTKDLLGAIERLRTVDVSRVCGVITDVKYDHEGQLITADFKPNGPMAEAAKSLLARGQVEHRSFSIRTNDPTPHLNTSPRFGYRGIGTPRPDGSVKLDHVVCWDLISE
ncbi:hypothetical protein [Serratia phage PCH45]|uniref:hypothetical protein n=1 Tax=Serratia phage PCH45 TaxID=2608368 RepID=UPI0012AA9075|nr:hypothetical protein [Serratia phage PCH45]